MILDRRLVAADLLKLRQRPRLLLPNMVLAAAGVAFFFAVQRDMGYSDMLGLVVSFAVVVGANIGSMAGSQDRESGLLRYLVATGRSRLALYVSRATAAGLLSALLVVPALALFVVL